MHDLDQLLRLGPMIPVIVIDEAAKAAPLAEALVAGGIRVLEVTLRTEAALEAIAAMARVEGVLVGAGTVLHADQARRAADAGASFLISPGLTEPLARAAADIGAPLLPGVETATEIMRGIELGLTRFKFFPASTSGRAEAVGAFAGPFPDICFCPTGGITLANAPGYLNLSNVLCVGGSWLTPRDAIRSGDWARITSLAAKAVSTLSRPDRPNLPPLERRPPC